MNDTEMIRLKLQDILDTNGEYEELLRLAYEKFSSRDLAKLLDVSTTWILKEIRKCEIPRRGRGGPNNYPKLFFPLVDWLTMSVDEIAVRYKCDRSWVYLRGKALGYPPRRSVEFIRQAGLYPEISNDSD